MMFSEKVWDLSLGLVRSQFRLETEYIKIGTCVYGEEISQFN
jgi:hypothetical protein